jgi:putative nucleotidyltransferase with HDIG domain
MSTAADGIHAAALLRWVGATYRAEGDRQAARDCFRASLAVACVHRARREVAHALNWLGIAYQDEGRLDRADARFNAARRLAVRARDRRILAMVEQNLGINCNIRGELNAALAHYRLALRCYERLGETRYIAQVQNVLGMLYTDLRRWAAAEHALQRSAALCRELGEVQTEVMVEVSRAELFVTRGRYDRARAACDRAHALALALGQEAPLGEVLRWYGTIERDSGAHDRAETSLRAAHAIARRHDIPLLEAEAQREMAMLFRCQKRNQEALQALLASRRIFIGLRASRDIADLGRRLYELETQFLTIVREWAESIEAKDPYTHGHCGRVAAYGTRLASQLGFGMESLRWFRMGAYLHDVGKMETPIEILNKPGQLTDEEFAIIQAHTTVGDRIVAAFDFPWDVRPLVRSHHERWDGRGYPDGLAGESIPLPARVLCVADVFDALTTARSYRGALPVAHALEIMRADSGRCFDPEIYNVFESLVTTSVIEIPAAA